MRGQEVALLLLLGSAIWVIGTIYYGYQGAVILETTSLRYGIAFLVSPVVSAIFCIAVLRWLHISPAYWASAMLLLAIPGMMGEAVVLSVIDIYAEAACGFGGKYGAFLFATYAFVLGVAEVVTLSLTLSKRVEAKPEDPLR